jgi:hypothetical protein
MYNESQMLLFQHIDMIYVLCLSSDGILMSRQDIGIMSLKCCDFKVWTRYIENVGILTSGQDICMMTLKISLYRQDICIMSL